MRICVFGAGAIGGHVAARLAKGGADVSVVARGAHLAAMAERGITVRAADGTFTVPVRASSDPAALGRQDAVIVTLKAPALPVLPQAIGPLLGPDTPVAFVMNGVPWWYFLRHDGPLAGTRLPRLDPDGAIERVIGVERTIGGTVYSACTVVEPGVIESTNQRSRVVLGELDGSDTPRIRAIAAALEGGGMGGVVSPDIRSEVWLKWMGNIANGPLAILTRSSLKDTYAEPALRDAARALMREGKAIAHALGAPIEVDEDARMKATGASPHKPSILQDLELGRPMEIDALFTVPMELGHKLGVKTPTLDLLSALGRQAARAAGLYAG